MSERDATAKEIFFLFNFSYVYMHTYMFNWLTEVHF